MLRPHCGRDNGGANSFCGGCGAPIGPKRLAFGRVNRTDSAFTLAGG